MDPGEELVKPPKYVPLFFEKIETGELVAEPGKVSHFMVAHDDWCDFFSGKSCNCNPEIMPWTSPDQEPS